MSGSYRMEPIAWTLRTYTVDAAGYDAHSNAEMTVQAVLPGIWAISAHRAHEPHTRGSLRALLQAMLDHDVRMVLADRETGHRLPGARPRADGVGFEIDVPVLARLLRHRIPENNDV